MRLIDPKEDLAKDAKSFDGRGDEMPHCKDEHSANKVETSLMLDVTQSALTSHVTSKEC